MDFGALAVRVRDELVMMRCRLGRGQTALTRQCYEGVGVPGHLGLPLVHVGHRQHLPQRLPDELT